MSQSTHEHLPLAPLLHAYRRDCLPDANGLESLPGLGPRNAAVRSAASRFLFPQYVQNAPDAELRGYLERFYEACVQVPLHIDTLRRRAGVVRHGLAHLLFGRDPLPRKLENCLSSSGPYFVAGLGPQFWSALAQALQPERHPAWTPATLTGLRRLGLACWPANSGPAALYAGLLTAYARIQAIQPDLSALRIDHFLSLVAGMRGRNLAADGAGPDPVVTVVEQLRQREGLRQRLKERGRQLAQAQELLESALARRDGKGIGSALATADPTGEARAPLDWGAQGVTLTLWVGRLWEAPEPAAFLSAFWEADPLPGAGLFLPAAVLHLRDPQQFAPWNEDIRRGLATLDDGSDSVAAPAERYQLHNEAVSWLRQRYQLHPLETPAVLASLGKPRSDGRLACRQSATGEPPVATADFGGFCRDTFDFLEELSRHNERTWMERQRDRYRFAVRQPLLELCQALAKRYVEPVLHGVHGFHLDTKARSGRALTSICKNAYGRTQPYNTALWIAFCRRPGPGPREGAQFFVRLDAGGLRFGLRIGRGARAAVACFRENVQRHADALWQTLDERAALADCRFGPAEEAGRQECLPHAHYTLAGPSALWDWAGGRSFEIARTLAAADPLLTRDELVGEILLTFDRLVPAYACAVEADPRRFLAGHDRPAAPRFTDADFQRNTSLDGDWLRRARELLELKRQLILQGVPGTGKTHVARCLARWLTAGRDDAIRLVQFHPAYSYEEFVEGIKVRTVEAEGRHDVTYPVEDGLLCAFAAEAASQPSQPFVLIIDEINRGNLPRLFGELLYLLEYREQSVRLPYSRRDFRLPTNLYLLGTMNAADRSVVVLDQALRRRFSLVEMVPDARILASWLDAHIPAAGPGYAARVLELFERLNARLLHDVGPQGRIGHSYFMTPELDEARLRMIWQHHIRPLLEERFADQPERLASYELDKLLDGPPRRLGGKRRPASLPH